jgi:hypothetical protein
VFLIQQYIFESSLVNFYCTADKIKRGNKEGVGVLAVIFYSIADKLIYVNEEKTEELMNRWGEVL